MRQDEDCYLGACRLREACWSGTGPLRGATSEIVVVEAPELSLKLITYVEISQNQQHTSPRGC